MVFKYGNFMFTNRISSERGKFFDVQFFDSNFFKSNIGKFEVKTISTPVSDEVPYLGCQVLAGIHQMPYMN